MNRVNHLGESPTEARNKAKLIREAIVGQEVSITIDNPPGANGRPGMLTRAEKQCSRAWRYSAEEEITRRGDHETQFTHFRLGIPADPHNSGVSHFLLLSNSGRLQRVDGGPEMHGNDRKILLERGERAAAGAAEEEMLRLEMLLRLEI